MLTSQLIADGGAIKTTTIDEFTLQEQQQVEAQAALEELVSFGNDIPQDDALIPEIQMQVEQALMNGVTEGNAFGIADKSATDDQMMEQQMLQQMNQEVPLY